MAAKGKALSIVLAIVAIFASSSAFASIPRPSILEPPAIDLRDDFEQPAHEEATETKIVVFTDDLLDVARIELPQPPIAEVLERRTNAMLFAYDHVRKHLVFDSNSAELASWPLASGDENNVNGERTLSLELHRATGFQALPFSEPATGLVYARARWYDPSTGTFLTPDPLGYQDSANLYAFAGGDPVNGRDPTGLDAQDEYKQCAAWAVASAERDRSDPTYSPTAVIAKSDARFALCRERMRLAEERKSSFGYFVEALGDSWRGSKAQRGLTQYSNLPEDVKAKIQKAWSYSPRTVDPAIAAEGGDYRQKIAHDLGNTVGDVSGEGAKWGTKAVQFGAETYVAGAVLNVCKTCVYSAVDEEGRTLYVGITDDMVARSAAHLRQKGIVINEIPGLANILRQDARAVEQVLIEHHGLGKTGGSLINKINSIATKNPKYAESLSRGRELLKSIGYPGFE